MLNNLPNIVEFSYRIPETAVVSAWAILGTIPLIWYHWPILRTLTI